MTQSTTYPWQCPMCHAEYKIRAGKQPPDRCPACTATPADIMDAAPPVPPPITKEPVRKLAKRARPERSGGIMQVVYILFASIAAVFAIILALVHVISGASSSPLEVLEGRSFVPGVAASAILFVMAATFTMVNDLVEEIRGLRDDLDRRASKDD